MNVFRGSSGALVVRVSEVAAALGYGDAAALREFAGRVRTKLKFIDEPDGSVVVEFDTAERFVVEARAWMEDHYSKWAAYRDYLERRRLEAAEERRKSAREELARMRADARRRSEAWDAQRAQMAEQEAREIANARHQRDGSPIPPDRFFKQFAKAGSSGD